VGFWRGGGGGGVVMNKKDRTLGRKSKNTKKARRKGVGKLKGEKEKNLKALYYDYSSCWC